MDEKRTSIIRHRYNWVAKVYDFLDAPMELMAFKRYRGEVLNNVHGKAWKSALAQQKTNLAMKLQVGFCNAVSVIEIY